MSDWSGIEIQLERDTGNIITTVRDSRETENPPINSALGYHDVGKSVNLYDGNWHNVMYMWSCDDRQSYPYYFSHGLGDAGVSALRQGVLLVDGIIIANTLPAYYNPGKQTPLTFVHNWPNQLATFISIGARTENAASTSLSNFTNVIYPYVGMMQRMIIWDCPIPDNGVDNLATTVNDTPKPVSQPGGIRDYGSYFMNLTYQNPGITSFVDPLSGTYFRSLSSHIVAYYKFDELVDTSTFATDWSGTASGAVAGGKQVHPDIGNTINWYDVNIETGDYQLQDIPNLLEDGVMKTGLVAFEDQAGVKHQVGFINYDLGFVVLDGEFCEYGGVTGVPFLQSIGISGMTTTLSLSSSNFFVKKINFVSQEFVESMIINLAASGTEMNMTENPTGIDRTTGGQLLEPPATWPQSVGLFNDFNELVGVAKFNTPIRKDQDHNVISQIKLDFSGSYPSGAQIIP